MGAPATSAAPIAFPPPRGLLLAGVVVVAHLGLADWLLGHMPRGGAAPVRLEISFVHEMQPAAAPVAAPAAPPRRTARRTAAPPSVAVEPYDAGEATPSAQAASAPAAAASGPPPAADPVATGAGPAAAEPVPESVNPEPAPTLVATTPPPAASAPPFEWPLSTRLNYVLSGNFRGPVEGQAQVEWLRRGERYQVHLELSIGPFFAPLVSRKLVSDGVLTEDGLSPRTYQEETRVAFGSPRQRQLQFEDGAIRMADGRRVPRPTGVQDSASQFVQMIWWFTMHPERLQPGQGFEVPLALPHRVEPWTYDVLGAETLYTPAGVFDAVRVRPRRPPRAGGDLVAESWLAPSLHYLPVRIVIRQDEETYVDLLLDRLPVQAAREPAAAASGPGAATR